MKARAFDKKFDSGSSVMERLNPESPVGREDRDGKGGLFDEQKSAGRSRDYGQTFL